MKETDPPELLLRDMVENARLAIDRAGSLAQADFFVSPLHQDAVIRRLEIVGEAARFVPAEVRQCIDLPWRKIVSMRHILAHDYDDVSLYVVWDVLTIHAPIMVSRIREYLAGQPISPSTAPDATARFIVFDGNEGCGKSTQAKLLQQHLQDRKIDSILVRDPGTTRVGELIRAILLNPDHDEMAMRCEMLLYMAARAQMMKEIIQPALDAGKWVISYRFVSSTLAYQLGGDGLTIAEIKAVADIAIGGRWPELTLILDMPVEMSRSRVAAKFLHKTKTLFGEETKEVKDRIEMREHAYHTMVRANFLAQAKALPDRYRVIDADRTPEVVHRDILAVAEV